MRFSQLIISVMGRLGNIPGLRFLHSYITAAAGMKSRFGQRKGDYEGFIYQGTSAVTDVRDAVRGSRGGAAGSAADDDEDYDDYDEEFEEDYYDQYDDGDSVSSQGYQEPVDDYPASDDHNSYFDDDYRR